jgi:signal transduction histidine kinase
MGLASVEQPLNSHVSSGAGDARVIRFTDIDTVRDNGIVEPKDRWARGTIGHVYRNADLSLNRLEKNAIWGRLHFDRKSLGAEPLALLTDHNRDRFQIWLNGREIFRSFTAQDKNFARTWYHPYTVRIPPTALRDGINMIIIRAESDHELSVGYVSIGPLSIVDDQRSYLQFWRIDGNFAANAMMLILSFIALFGWTMRREETGLLLIGVSGFAWFVRNYHFFVEQHGFDQVWYMHVTNLFSVLAPLISTAFCFSFLKIKHRHGISGGLAIASIILWIAHVVGLTTTSPLFAFAFLIGIITFIIVLFGAGKTRTTDHWVLAGILTLVCLASLHDIYRGVLGGRGGLGFYMQSYFGLVFALGFLASFGRRALGAFTAVNVLNATLEDKVERARADLLASEAKRRRLEVEAAVGSERERLMREMHDGIGSNLVVALAAAEKEKQPVSTIKTLRRALSDLRITVDSVEPINGDVLALLANFRHRMAPDLKRAGIKTTWNPGDCPPVEWLDANSALHLMRLFQEIVSNILSHAEATQIDISCGFEQKLGADGIEISFADNGIGFDSGATSSAGKGISNMRARMVALNGEVELASQSGSGTRISLWIPLLR